MSDHSHRAWAMLSLPVGHSRRLGARLWLTLSLAIAMGLGGAAGAGAATLIEARNESGPLRFVVDRGQDRVRLSSAAGTLLFDLAGGFLYVEQAGGAVGRVRAYYRPGHGELPPYRLQLFGRGPLVAGHMSEYHVLFAAEEVCAELMLSAWMAPFVDPAVRALSLLEQLQAGDDDDACARIPFATYAAPGWPLLAGKRHAPTFETLSVRFDYQPTPDELALPTTAQDLSPGDLPPLDPWLIH